jgi:hypothetical protein
MVSLTRKECGMMRALLLIAATVAPVLLIAPRVAHASDGSGACWPLSILSPKAVQADLALSEEQKSALRTLAEEYEGRSKPPTRDEVTKELRRILKPEQLARFRQIRWQFCAAAMLLDERTEHALKLTELQVKQLHEAWEEGASELARRKSSIRFASARDESFYDINFWRTNERIFGILTDDQKTTLTKLKGKPLPESAFEPPDES